MKNSIHVQSNSRRRFLLNAEPGGVFLLHGATVHAFLLLYINSKISIIEITSGRVVSVADWQPYGTWFESTYRQNFFRSNLTKLTLIN